MEFEAEVLAGLAHFARAEVAEVGGAVTAADDTSVRFHLSGAVRRLLQLRTVVAVYALDVYDVPRPKALLGEQHLQAMVVRIANIRTLGQFSSFRISAAGHDSVVFRRIASELSRRTGLEYDEHDGDLVLRFRTAGRGWEILSRLSPRPLSAREWRRRDRRGALNATIAAAMVAWTDPARADRYLNLACGTGTLLVERRTVGPAALLVGVDADPAVLDDARVNGAEGLLRADAGRLPLSPASFDVITADLPYGTTMGSPAENERLYPALLAEAARVATQAARFAVITHDIQRFERVLAAAPAWETVQQIQVFQKGHHPKIWLLRRTRKTRRTGS